MELRVRVRWIAETYQERAGERLGTMTLVRDEVAFGWTLERLY